MSKSSSSNNKPSLQSSQIRKIEMNFYRAYPSRKRQSTKASIFTLNCCALCEIEKCCFCSVYSSERANTGSIRNTVELYEGTIMLLMMTKLMTMTTICLTKEGKKYESKE
jgi:hypothetical protein